MVVEKHEEPLMQLMVLYKLGPSAPEVHLAPPIIVHIHFVGSSSPRFFVADCFTKLTPIHELGEFQRNMLYLTALSTGDAEEGIDLGRRRRRRSIAWSSARTWKSSRYLGFVLLPTGRPGRRFTDADDKATVEASFGLFLLLWGRPRPHFSICTPASRLAPPASAIRKLRLMRGKTLDEMWRKKTMRRRKLVMKGLGFSLAGVLYL
jgi:hypothetical protein